jgi:hypothetical protein
MDDHDERIRQRAHEIWEEEGRPEGREYSHWLRARADMRDADGDSSERASKADIALNTLPPGTVPENPTGGNPNRIVQLRPAAKKPLDARDIDTQLDQPF